VWQRGDPVYTVLVVKSDENNHLEDLGVDGSIMLKPVFEKWDGEALTD
jgi:hypothetical protein